MNAMGLSKHNHTRKIEESSNSENNNTLKLQQNRSSSNIMWLKSIPNQEEQQREFGSPKYRANNRKGEEIADREHR